MPSSNDFTLTQSQILNIWKYAQASLLIVTALSLPKIFEFAAMGTFDKHVNEIMLALFLIAIFYSFWNYMVIACTQFRTDKDTLNYKHGVLNTTTDPIQLYRVKDITAYAPIYLRIFGLGSITIYSSDKTSPELNISAIKNHEMTASRLMKLVEKSRVEKGVREFD